MRKKVLVALFWELPWSYEAKYERGIEMSRRRTKVLFIKDPFSLASQWYQRWKGHVMRGRRLERCMMRWRVSNASTIAIWPDCFIGWNSTLANGAKHNEQFIPMPNSSLKVVRVPNGPLALRDMTNMTKLETILKFTRSRHSNRSINLISSQDSKISHRKSCCEIKLHSRWAIWYLSLLNKVIEMQILCCEHQVTWLRDLTIILFWFNSKKNWLNIIKYKVSKYSIICLINLSRVYHM